jgi:hypothetical protein
MATKKLVSRLGRRPAVRAAIVLSLVAIFLAGAGDASARDGAAGPIRSNVARYLAAQAGSLRVAPPQCRLAAIARNVPMARLAITHGKPQNERALRIMEEIWQAVRGYYPGRAMPIPLFTDTPGQDAGGAVGWANGWSVGIRWGRDMTKQLVRPVDAWSRDDVLRVLLHEWAHNFQLPEYHAGPTVRVPSGHRVHPLAEGGAEAFAYAVAPLVARKLGRPYSVRKASLRGDEYRPFVVDVTLHRGMDWILRGQFNASPS